MPKESRSPRNATLAEVSPITLRRYYEGRLPISRLFGRGASQPVDVHDPTQVKALLASLRDFDPDLRMTVKLAV